MIEGKATGSVRERLLQAADDLFYREGVHTVGIERILERAGVAKASLYSTFGSKDELVRAYLESRVRALRERIEKRIADVEDPRERILAVFDGFVDRVEEGSYYGCPFMRACAEAPPAPNPARDVTEAFRSWRHDLFARLAKDAGSPEPDITARQLSILYDGAAVGASMHDGTAAAVAAREAVEHLFDEHARPSTKTKKATPSRKARTK